MTSPLVREATRADADALVTLRALMFEAMGTDPAALEHPVWRVRARDWFLEAVGAAAVRVVVAEVDAVVASSAVGEVTALAPGPSTPNGSVGLLSNVATLPQHRGLGLAAACTDDVLAWFREHTDVTRVDLFATEAGARVYAPRGFVTVSQPAMRRRVERL
ncbi:GNAT family N-acetyltransferase [Phycicoccus avicenniae]|uniref:GNAT family N-acetyltransferase n=1 Tax=Phycicoccus avicenniae TaxID=2828860 RepID=UPI003D27EAB4